MDPLDQVFMAAGDCIFATGEYVLDKVPIGIIRRPGGGGGGRGARGARGGRVHHKKNLEGVLKSKKIEIKKDL